MINWRALTLVSMLLLALIGSASAGEVHLLD
jgi:hypothetical protein